LLGSLDTILHRLELGVVMPAPVHNLTDHPKRFSRAI
jgi:hypothetical protein